MITGVDLSVSALPISSYTIGKLRTLKEVFDALGKVSIPRYVLSFGGNLKYEERKEFRFFESIDLARM